MTKLHYDDLNLVFSLCDDRFPALGTNSSQNDDFPPADRWFPNGCRVNKMTPLCFLGRIPLKAATKNGGSSLDGEFPAHWNALKGFQCISMGFLFLHYDVFVLQRFRWNELTS